MGKKKLKKVVVRIVRINKEGDIEFMGDSTEIFNLNKEIISRSIESSTGVVEFDPELLTTGMFAS